MLRIAAICLALLMAAPVAAQQGQLPQGVVILDQERLFADSLYGQRVQAELDAAGQALAAENRSIEAALTSEELELTERRAEMPREEFAVLAEEFDIRVEALRDEQDAKARALSDAIDRARQQFFDLAVPVLLDLVQARGAAVILDNRAVLLSADTVDITDAAIAAVDERLGEGPDEPLLELVPDIDALP